jgi:[acyl-carrier-protein] S-malonyltransferase
MAVSLAAMRALESRGFSLKDKVAYVAGHSLGEYSALAAAGFVSIADAARLLRIRGNAMQAAVPPGEGAMAAIIGLEQPEVDAACTEAAQGEVCQIANDNGGGQLVISGSKAAVERAAALCTAKGAKRALMLQVSAPFHSALMAPAGDAMREALAGVQRHAPVVPVVSNVSVEPTSEPDLIAARLVEQVTGRVRWRETVEWFGANGVTTLYEIGAGKVLSGLARRINRDIAVSSVGTPADVDAALAALG